MSAIDAVVRAQIENLLAEGAAGPPPSAAIATATAAEAVAAYGVAESVLVEVEAVAAALLAVQVVVSGEPNSPFHLQDTVEAMTKQIALAAEVLADMEAASSAAIAGIAG